MTRLFRALALFLFLIPALRAQDGIYADFSTTLGNFTCQLRYDLVPRTVANFISLATGERGWLDIPSGDAKHTPFYSGLTFHRVVSGFVIQGGSPKGDGTDGPGYTFKDEFTPALRHDDEGVLSMANSGLNSNGSQFFITLAAESHLDDVHSIFGKVTNGIEVVRAIGAVSTDTNGKPNTPVVMAITIRRVGTAAQAFDAMAQGLPNVGGAKPVLVKNNANFLLQFNRALSNDYWVYYGSDLKTWNRTHFGIYTTALATGDIDVTGTTTGQSHFFYRVPQITYPGPLYTPAGITGSTLTLNTTTVGTITYVISPTGAATCTYSGDGSVGTLTSGSWAQEAYRGKLAATQTNIVAIQVDCAFNSAGAGVFKGTAGSSTPISGTFTYTTP